MPPSPLQYVVRPEDFGPVGYAEDQTTASNNVAALRAAIAYFGKDNPGIIEHGPLPINEQIVFNNMVTLRGVGYGRSNKAAVSAQSYIKWVRPPVTSTSPVTIGLGAKQFIIQSGLTDHLPGIAIRVWSDADNWMEGYITSYVGAALTVNVDRSSGSGELSAWQCAISMLRVTNNFGFSIRDTRIIGSYAAPPLSAIDFCDMPTHPGAVDVNGGSNLWIGPLYGLDTDNDVLTNEFIHGMLFSGTINGDTNKFDRVFITSCQDTGVYLKNPNASGTSFDTVSIKNVKNCIRSSATVFVKNMFARSREHAFVLNTAGKIYVDGLAAESSGGIFKIEGNVTKLVIINGDWQVQANTMFADGVIGEIGSSTVWYISFENFGLQIAKNYGNPPKPVFRLYNTAGGLTNGTFRVIGGWGIYHPNLDCGELVGHHDTRNIIFEPGQFNSQDHAPRQALHCSYAYPEDRKFESWRNDFAGKVNVFGGPLNVRRVPAQPYSPVVTPTGSGTAEHRYLVTNLTRDGESKPSLPRVVLNADVLSPGVATNKVGWVFMIGAHAYNIYKGSSGQEKLVATVTWDSLHGDPSVAQASPPSWIDDGTAVPGASMPTGNSTGNLVVEGSLKLPNASWQSPLVIGPLHLWADATNALRTKASPPMSDTDGTLL